jgi:hypothetical protein
MALHAMEIEQPIRLFATGTLQAADGLHVVILVGVVSTRYLVSKARERLK